MFAVRPWICDGVRYAQWFDLYFWVHTHLIISGVRMDVAQIHTFFSIQFIPVPMPERIEKKVKTRWKVFPCENYWHKKEGKDRDGVDGTERERVREQKGLELCWYFKIRHARALFIFYHCRLEHISCSPIAKSTSRTHMWVRVCVFLPREIKQSD